MPYRRQHGRDLYSQSVGPLTTPRRVIDSILAGGIDVGPLDSYAWDLLQRHDPDLTERIRIVETTDAAPIPFLVASRQCPDRVVTALQTALMEFGEIAACDGLRERLCLQSFAPVVITEYDLMMRWNTEARRRVTPTRADGLFYVGTEVRRSLSHTRQQRFVAGNILKSVIVVRQTSTASPRSSVISSRSMVTVVMPSSDSTMAMSSSPKSHDVGLSMRSSR